MNRIEHKLYLVGGRDGVEACEGEGTSGLAIGAAGEVENLLAGMDADISLSVGLQGGGSGGGGIGVRRRSDPGERSGLLHETPGDQIGKSVHLSWR